MVYRGPSKACLNCRQRRVKCDQTRPACNVCVRLKDKCSGYAHLFQHLHRDETVLTKSRVQRWTVETRAAQIARSVAPSINVLPLNPEHTATELFFKIYCWADSNPQRGGGFMLQLADLYRNAPVDSPLIPAVNAVAAGISMFWFQPHFDMQRIQTLYMASIRSLIRAISDKRRAIQDDVLMTSLALIMIESLQEYFVPNRAIRGSHTHGALAIVAQRGQLNSRDDASKMMTGTIASWVMNSAIVGETDVPAQAVRLLEHIDPNTDQLRGLGVLHANIANIQTQYKSISQKKTPLNFVFDNDEYQGLLSKALALDQSLIKWYEALTQQSRPYFASTETLSESIKVISGYGEIYSVYYDTAVADLHCRFRIRRLSLLDTIHKLICSITSTVGTNENEELINYIDICIQILVDDICQSIPFYLGNLSEPTNPIAAHMAEFPSVQTDHGCLPAETYEHGSRTVSSAGMLVRFALAMVVDYAEPKDGLFPIQIRTGQLNWIKGQILRIQRIFRIQAVTQTRNLTWIA